MSAAQTHEQVSRRILVVEDEALIARDLACTLQDLGYAIVGVASTSAQAVRFAEELRPELVLMDIRLRGGPDGIQTAARIRETLSVAVVYLTANNDAETLQRALATSPGGYLAKPFDSRTLRTTIEVALLRHHEESLMSAASDRGARQTTALKSVVRELSGLVSRLRQESITDALTGVQNRRSLDANVSSEVSRIRRRGGSLGVILIDVDHFKRVNDECGHEAGDEVLRSIGRLLRGELRDEDTAYRYGGEEFVVLAPGAELRGACGIAERLRHAIASLAIARHGKRLPSVTASFGVAAFPEHAAEHLLRRADQALYRAKHEGRDNVFAASARTGASDGLEANPQVQGGDKPVAALER